MLTKTKLLFWEFFGTFAGLGLIAYLSDIYNVPLLIPSFGATAVLIYAAAHVPMAQPKNVVGGHVLSALIGVMVARFVPVSPMTLALGVAFAVSLMSLTQTLHPPGGATAFVAIYTKQSFDFVLMPVLLGVLVLLTVALISNRLAGKEYRLLPQKTGF